MHSKAQTLVQPETAGIPHVRILKNRPVPTKQLETLETKADCVRVGILRAEEDHSTQCQGAGH